MGFMKVLGEPAGCHWLKTIIPAGFREKNHTFTSVLVVEVIHPAAGGGLGFLFLDLDDRGISGQEQS